MLSPHMPPDVMQQEEHTKYAHQKSNLDQFQPPDFSHWLTGRIGEAGNMLNPAKSTTRELQ